MGRAGGPLRASLLDGRRTTGDRPRTSDSDRGQHAGHRKRTARCWRWLEHPRERRGLVRRWPRVRVAPGGGESAVARGRLDRHQVNSSGDHERPVVAALSHQITKRRVTARLADHENPHRCPVSCRIGTRAYSPDLPSQAECRGFEPRARASQTRRDNTIFVGPAAARDVSQVVPQGRCWRTGVPVLGRRGDHGTRFLRDDERIAPSGDTHVGPWRSAEMRY